MGELRAMKECPACGELYPAGQDCECGYCDHAGAAIGETCPICGGCVEPAMPNAVAELLDAADAMVVALGDWPLFPWQAAALRNLRAVVTRLQGTAGLSVTAGGGA